jgi:hypothetical protein
MRNGPSASSRATSGTAISSVTSIDKTPRPTSAAGASSSKPPSQSRPNKTSTAPPVQPTAAIPGPMPPPMYFIPPGGLPFFQAQAAIGANPGAAMNVPAFFGAPPSGQPPSTDLRRSNPYSDDIPSPKKRRVRHCAKCGSPTCKGRGGGSNCPNPCRDCGKTECKGRSSTKPGRVCDTAAAME